MMNQQRLFEWIRHPEQLNRETLYELRTLLARYPYFQTARLLYLQNLFLLHDISFGEELRRAALYVGDRSVLFRLVEGGHYNRKALEQQVRPEPGVSLDRTLTLIDAFLATLPEEESAPRSVVPLEIATDYTAYLLQEPDAQQAPADQPKLQGQHLIDSFLERSEEEPVIPSLSEEIEVPSLPEAQPVETEPSDEESDEILEDESYFTETLAKIYVKQQRYSKALEIIRKLNLKYPKKNAYFADQIRFLEKLIINAKS